MIIESKFRDYYDAFASGIHRDPKIVFQRKMKAFPSSHASSPLLEMLREETVYDRKGRITMEEHSIGVVLLAGKLYPVYIHKTINELYERKFSFDYEAPYEKMPKPRNWGGSRGKKSAEKEELKKPRCRWGQAHPEAQRLNAELGPIIFLSTASKPWPSREAESDKNGTINPALKHLRFPMAGHEIVQILSGFLGATAPEIKNPSDKTKAQAHGMDKTSFRRDKGGPTRKRKATP